VLRVVGHRVEECEAKSETPMSPRLLLLLHFPAAILFFSFGTFCSAEKGANGHISCPQKSWLGIAVTIHGLACPPSPASTEGNLGLGRMYASPQLR
jgi:hypothetical protein